MRGFFKGLKIASLGITVYKGTAFMIFENILKLIEKVDFVSNSVVRHSLASAPASLMAQMFAYPFEIMKRRMMVSVDKEDNYYKIIITMWMEGGSIRSFFKGFTINLLKVIS